MSEKVEQEQEEDSPGVLVRHDEAGAVQVGAIGWRAVHYGKLTIQFDEDAIYLLYTFVCSLQ